MTIITAISDGTSVWLGHNSAVALGDTPIYDGFNPWVTFGDWALGVTGASYQQDLLTLHSKTLEENSQSHLELIDCIRTLFLENDVSITDDEFASPSFGIWSILVNKNGLIWDVGCRLSSSPISTNRLWASGSGTDFAIGADYAVLQTNTKIPLSERVRIATSAAIENDINCPGHPIVSQLSS